MYVHMQVMASPEPSPAGGKTVDKLDNLATAPDFQVVYGECEMPLLPCPQKELMGPWGCS